ncbi:MAG: DUF6108 family protein [Lachnoclostridium sp.]|nr:DUF6108 family protein [Lachnoclostridium sp.]
MKRFLLLLIAVISLTTNTLAQKNLATSAVFDGRYRGNPAASETVITGSALDGYNLDRYHGITLKNLPDEADFIEPLVIRDGSRAADKEVMYREGRLYYGFYVLPGSFSHRYLFYLNQNVAGGNKIVLVYMEGNASTSEIKKMMNLK